MRIAKSMGLTLIGLVHEGMPRLANANHRSSSSSQFSYEISKSTGEPVKLLKPDVINVKWTNYRTGIDHLEIILALCSDHHLCGAWSVPSSIELAELSHLSSVHGINCIGTAAFNSSHLWFLHLSYGGLMRETRQEGLPWSPFSNGHKSRSVAKSLSDLFNRAHKAFSPQLRELI
ncbi:hypothetical protein VNO77_20999 [Canavalia gladiata]|uniref:Uncharacterized protein n=1 Tax=Canavalia gladiata TaxID=3824 RepID=A0AAN9LUN3_CANGL